MTRSAVRWMAILVLVGAVAACAERVPVDVDRAQLMPQSVATRVIERYLGAAWLERPRFTIAACFRNDEVILPIGSIRGAVYNAQQRSLFIMNYPDIVLNCDLAFVQVANIPIETAREIATAFVSLGAPIESVR